MISFAKLEDKFDNKSRGKSSGVILSLGDVSKILAPLISGFLADRFFVSMPFITTMFLLTIMLWYLVVFWDEPEKKSFHKRKINIITELKSFLSVRELRGMGFLGFFMHSTIPATQIFLPIYIIFNLGKDYTSVGLIYFFMHFFLLFQFFWGGVADKFGRAKVMITGTILSGIGIAAIAFTNDFNMLIVSIIVLSIGNSLWNVSALTILSECGEKIKKEGEVLGSYFSISKMGNFISSMTSGVIVAAFGIKSIFLIAGALVMLASIVSIHFFTRPESA